MVGSAENKANSTPLELGLGLSLAMNWQEINIFKAQFILVMVSQPFFCVPQGRNISYNSCDDFVPGKV